MKHIICAETAVKVLCKNKNNLFWQNDLGIGYLESNGCEYGDDYWEKYQFYSASPIAVSLNKARIDFVKRNYDFDYGDGSFCDIGIGNGDFVKETGCDGFDINPNAVKWLDKYHTYGNPYQIKYNAVSMWDVLEHIDNPGELLTGPNAPIKVFTSLPIHKDLESCINSKHLRPDEHIWHFTKDGFIRFMEYYNYGIIECSEIESELGRESISSFYFKKSFK